MHRCKNHAKLWCWRCIGITLSFPIEHVIWEKAPFLSRLLPLIGLH